MAVQMGTIRKSLLRLLHPEFMQALESAQQSLAEFCERSGFTVAGEPTKRKPDSLPLALATVFWAYSLAARSGIKTPTGLERRFEPGAFRMDTHGAPFHLNKWSGYFSGRHVPRKVLGAVEREFPGANACLTSPLWDALVSKPLSLKQIDALVRRLSPEVQQLMRRRGMQPSAKGRANWPIDFQLARMLERRAGLDELAALVLLIRHAQVSGWKPAAHQWSRCVLRMLVLLGEQLLAGGIALPLVELINLRIADWADLDGTCYALPTPKYMRVLYEFYRAMSHLEGHPLPSIASKDWRELSQRVLSADFGFDHFYAFNPVLVLVAQSSTTDPGSHASPGQSAVVRTQWLQEWAMNMLELGGHRYAPPHAALTGRDLWAFDPEDPIAKKWLAHLRHLESRGFSPHPYIQLDQRGNAGTAAPSR